MIPIYFILYQERIFEEEDFEDTWKSLSCKLASYGINIWRANEWKNYIVDEIPPILQCIKAKFLFYYWRNVTLYEHLWLKFMHNMSGKLEWAYPVIGALMKSKKTNNCHLRNVKYFRTLCENFPKIYKKCYCILVKFGIAKLKNHEFRVIFGFYAYQGQRREKKLSLIFDTCCLDWGRR